MKLYIPGKEDRDAVTLALAQSGYTVRQGTEKTSDSKRSISFVEVTGRGIE